MRMRKNVFSFQEFKNSIIIIIINYYLNGNIVYIVTFCHFNASLLNTSINFYQTIIHIYSIYRDRERERERELALL